MFTEISLLQLIIIALIIYLIYVFITSYYKEEEEVVVGKAKGKAITFGGGGFRSVGTFGGMLTGVLEAGNRTKDIHLKELLNGFDVVSCVSGGTAFYHYVSHSKKFYDMIDKSARGEQELFGGCDNIPIAEYGLFGCYGEGVNNCLGRFNSLCCCEDGYMTTQDGCVKCQTKPYQTMNGWIKSYADLFADELNDSLDVENDKNWITDLLFSNVDEDLYLAYILFTGHKDFNEIFKAILLETIDDFDANARLGSNVNGLTSIVTVAATILSDGSLGDNTKYNVGDGATMALPVSMVYKSNGNGDEFLDRGFMKNNRIRTITYSSDGDDITVDLPSGVNTPDMTVGQSILWSSSAFSVASSNIFLAQTLSDLGLDPYDYDKNGIVCDKPGCNVTEYLAHRFRIFAPVSYIPGAGEYPTPQYGSETLVHSKSEYEQKIPFRMGDGALNTDMNGVIDAVYELQQKFENDTDLKIVVFCKTEELGPGDDILQLFGKVKSCVTDLETEGDVDATSLGPINIRKSNVQVFDSKGCDGMKTIFDKTYHHALDDLSPGFRCDMFNMCDPKVNVYAWSGLKTTSNWVRGIKAGYNVDLFVVGHTSPPVLDRIAALPGDEISKLDKSIYSITANRLSRLSYNAARDLPDHLYDVIFGEAEYFPEDFEDVSTSL